MNKNLICFIFFTMVLLSCNSGEERIPGNILQKDKMVAVMTDVQIAEASILYQNSRGNIVENRAKDYYRYVFEKHRITEKQFRESFTYYTTRPELMDKLYEAVIIEISKRQAEQSNK
jgi:hypothetical protein